MAKKAVASLQKGGKGFAKIIRTVVSPKTGAYSFKDEIVPVEMVKEALKR
tara:strand:+ start:5876 stop:6025 length:150 start_codon:yes stop_codon:yes gene_type:complete